MEADFFVLGELLALIVGTACTSGLGVGAVASAIGGQFNAVEGVVIIEIFKCRIYFRESQAKSIRITTIFYSSVNSFLF